MPERLIQERSNKSAAAFLVVPDPDAGNMLPGAFPFLLGRTLQVSCSARAYQSPRALVGGPHILNGER